MENLGARGNDVHLSRQAIQGNFSKICEFIDQFPLKFNPLSKKFDISQEALENFIAESSFFRILSIHKVNKTAGGDYIYGNINPAMLGRWIKEGNQLFSNTPVLHFKGEDICMRITELSNVDKNSIMKKVPHPAVTKYAKTQLTKITNNYFIKTYGI